MRVDALPEVIAAAARGLRSAAVPLAQMPLAERAEAIALAARELLDENGELGRWLRVELRSRTRLSGPAIEYGLQTTLARFDADTLRALAARRPARAAQEPKLCVAVLAGNVFSAAVRPLLFPLLCGHPVLAKGSSRDDALPLGLEAALARVEPRLARACAITTFARGTTRELEAALFAEADLVSMYGSDATLAALRADLPARAQLIMHGHGGGAIWIAADVLASLASARELADRVALDVAAYDQRGCLSPQALFVEQGGAIAPREFARMLSVSLVAIEKRMPRGDLDEAAAAEQSQWRGVAAALHESWLNRGSAVSFELDGPLRGSPGYRNVSVYAVLGLAELRARLAALGSQLKALGVAGEHAAHELAGAAPYVCAVGSMQDPPLDARLDGLDPLEGY